MYIKIQRLQIIRDQTNPIRNGDIPSSLLGYFICDSFSFEIENESNTGQKSREKTRKRKRKRKKLDV